MSSTNPNTSNDTDTTTNATEPAGRKDLLVYIRLQINTLQSPVTVEIIDTNVVPTPAILRPRNIEAHRIAAQRIHEARYRALLNPVLHTSSARPHLQDCPLYRSANNQYDNPLENEPAANDSGEYTFLFPSLQTTSVEPHHYETVREWSPDQSYERRISPPRPYRFPQYQNRFNQAQWPNNGTYNRIRSASAGNNDLRYQHSQNQNNPNSGAYGNYRHMPRSRTGNRYSRYDNDEDEYEFCN